MPTLDNTLKSPPATMKAIVIETGQTQPNTTPAEEYTPEEGSGKSHPPPDNDPLSDLNWKYNLTTGMLPEVIMNLT